MIGPRLLLCVLALAGCRPARGPRRVDVTIQGMRFVPESVTVAIGDTVRWTDRDLVPHTATGQGWEAGPILQDSSRVWVVTGGERFAYHCRFHPTMTGSITVE